MVRRLRWMAAGVGLGLGGQWWAKRTARRAAASLRPTEASRRVARGARSRVRAARVDARSARLDTEQRLRQRLGAEAPVIDLVDRTVEGTAAPPFGGGSPGLRATSTPVA